MTEITIYPVFFLIPGLCLVAAVLLRNKFAFSVAALTFALAGTLSVMASNPVDIYDGVKAIVWDHCGQQVQGEKKTNDKIPTCRIQFGPAEEKP